MVVVADSDTDPNRTTALIPINDECIAFVFRGINGSQKFIDKHVLPLKNSNFPTLLQKATEEFNQHHKDFENEDFSFVVVSFFDGKPHYCGFWYDDKKNHYTNDEIRSSYFIKNIDDLSIYLTNKAYSTHMSLDELKNFTVFIALQCMKIMNFDFNVEVVTISDKGVKKLSKDEIKDIFHKQDQLDHKLKKIFSDLFVTEINQ